MTAEKIEVTILERGLVENLSALVIQHCLYAHLCNIGSHCSKRRSQSSFIMERPKEDGHMFINDFLIKLCIRKLIRKEKNMLCITGRKHNTNDLC